MGENTFTIDEVAGSMLDEQVANKHRKNDCVKRGSVEASTLFQDAYIQSCDRSGSASIKTSFGPRTIQATFDRLDVSENKGRTISEVRVIRFDLPRNAITQAVAMDACLLQRKARLFER